MRITRRTFARLSLASGLAALLAACRRRAEVPAPPALPIQAEPGRGGGTARYREAPMLAEQVARGELPPVDERLPEAPYVLEVNGEIGVYGGAWRQARSAFLQPYALRVNNGMTCLDRDLTIKPYIAESWELDETGSTITWHLRRGMRWSDGRFVTSEDAQWFWLAGIGYPEIGHSGLEKRARVQLVDAHTWTFSLNDTPNYNTFVQPVSYASTGIALPLVPTHYARLYHPDHAEGGLAALEQLARSEGHAGWVALYRSKTLSVIDLPGKPTLQPWRILSKRGAPTILFERNPYFWQVDGEGQQLPYLDHVLCQQVSGENALEMMIQNGEVDCQLEGVLAQREESYRLAGYGMQHYPSGEHIVLQFNPTTSNRALASLVAHREARQALSLAINRAQLQVLYGDLAEPRQFSPIEASPLYDKELSDQYLAYDPAQAGDILDRLGYDGRDAEGYRLSPDGVRLAVMVHGAYDLEEPVAGRLAMHVLEVLEHLGLKCSYLQRDPNQIHANLMSGALDATIGPLGGTLLPPFSTSSGFCGLLRAHVWCGWKSLPQPHYIYDLGALYSEILLEPDLDARISLFREYLASWKRELPLIGLLGGFTQVGIAKEGFMNLEDGIVYDQVTNYEAFQHPQQFSWRRPAPHAIPQKICGHGWPRQAQRPQ